MVWLVFSFGVKISFIERFKLAEDLRLSQVNFYLYYRRWKCSVKNCTVNK